MQQAWVGSLKGVMPENGHPISRDALFMSEASGVSVDTLMQWDSDPEVIQEVLRKQINSSQVSNAA